MSAISSTGVSPLSSASSGQVSAPANDPNAILQALGQVAEQHRAREGKNAAIATLLQNVTAAELPSAGSVGQSVDAYA